MPVIVTLDESQFGNVTQDPNLPLYSFYYTLKDEEVYITNRRSINLVAVTKDQFNTWKNKKIYVKSD